MIFWQTGNEFVLGTVIPVGVMWLVMFHRVVYFVYYLYSNLPEVVQSNLWMFADDTKIYYTISSSEGSILLQGDLHSS